MNPATKEHLAYLDMVAERKRNEATRLAHDPALGTTNALLAIEARLAQLVTLLTPAR